MSHPNTIRSIDNQIQLINSLIPHHPFSCSLIGPRGCSKTTVMINMLMNAVMYRRYFHNIIVLSSSIRLDPKWSALMREKGILARGAVDNDDMAIDLTGCRLPALKFTGKLDPDCMFMEYRQDILEDLIKDQCPINVPAPLKNGCVQQCPACVQHKPVSVQHGFDSGHRGFFTHVTFFTSKSRNFLSFQIATFESGQHD